MIKAAKTIIFFIDDTIQMRRSGQVYEMCQLLRFRQSIVGMQIVNFYNKETPKS